MSITKLLAGLGGVLLVASFFLPLADTSQPAARNGFGITTLQREIDTARELDAVRPLVDPALQALEKFAASPSFFNLTGVAGATGKLLDTAAGLGVPEPDKVRMLAGVLGWVRTGLWLLPLVGLAQLVVPAVTRLRGYTGALGLISRFCSGWLFLLVALVPLLGAPDGGRALIGPAIWTLLVGAVLLVIAGFGVTRRNWWAVLLANLTVVAATIAAVKAFADAAARS